jgi:AhpD family alkylhydroperoxidase
VKELIALAVAHVTQCPHCIKAHARRARANGASEQELMEAIWVAAEMRAGAAYAHSRIAFRAGEPSTLAMRRRAVSDPREFTGYDY